jgi:hypothetical protein
MSTSDQRLAFSARFLGRPFAFVCAALLLLSSSANAETVLQFAQTNPHDVITATDNGSGTTTLSTAGNVDGGNVSVPVTITNFLGVPGLAIPAFETYVGVTSIGAASTSHGSIFQNFSGTIEITSGVGGTGFNYLTATFSPVGGSSAVGLSGAAGGGAAALQAAQPPDNLLLTSNFALLGPASSFSVPFSNVSPALHIAGDSSIASFTAQDAATVSASIVAIIPEPSSLCLGSIAIVIGAIAYGKKRMKVEG